jgi:hypothetical protein
MIYTLVIVAFMAGQPPEYSMQHFDTQKSCAQAGVAIAGAYYTISLNPIILGQCMPGYEV